MPKSISIVIPVHNEEKIVEKNVNVLEDYLKQINIPGYEIILVENGSQDKTIEKIKNIVERNNKVSFLSISYPAFGEAIKEGILRAKYNIVILSMDLCYSMDFIDRSIKLLDDYPVVLGSRYMKTAKINRNKVRHLISIFYPPIANTLCGTSFSDFDAVKAFRNDIAKKLVRKTMFKDNFFFTELLVLIFNSNIKYVEIPVDHIEHRKSRFKFSKLVFPQVKNLIFNYRRLKGLKLKDMKEEEK